MIEDFPLLSPETVLNVYFIQGCVPEGLLDGNRLFAGSWVEAGYSYLFFTGEADDIIRLLLARVQGLKFLDRYRLTYRQWQGEQPELIQIGRFAVTPPWVQPASGEDLLPVILDPGLVFGDGTHPTTADCLEAVEAACREQRVSTMLDLGAGTGILAVGGALLGCCRVLAVEYTFLAARTARRNVLYNRLGDRVLVVNGRAEDFAAVEAELLVANIGYGVIKNLILSGQLRKHRAFILSGLLQGDAEKVVSMCGESGLCISRQWGPRPDGWKTVMGHPA